ncbi:hypothetical protein NA78x_000033 [Anatilimnocola sp. NA78]|uniref:hypothetical protein n=1 Tax=Anatilimnocola sp. NA78 TaxID=3415683 RepID=UPI003CE53007
MPPLTPFIADWLLLAQEQVQQKQPLLMKLDGPTRAKVLAALAALVMLGFLLVTLAWLGARMTRRYMGSAPKKLPPTKLPSDEEWAREVVTNHADDEPRNEQG